MSKNESLNWSDRVYLFNNSFEMSHLEEVAWHPQTLTAVDVIPKQHSANEFHGSERTEHTYLVICMIHVQSEFIILDK